MIPEGNAVVLQKEVDGDVQVVYSEILKSEFFTTDMRRRLAELREKTGVKPAEDLMQKAYDRLFRRGYIGMVEKIWALSGVEPEICENTVHEGYRLLSEFKQYVSVANMINYTGIMPDKELLIAHPEIKKKLRILRRMRKLEKEMK